MVLGKTKRIVVIKDISSNIIEEAILILRAEPDAKEGKGLKGLAKANSCKGRDYLLKEAQLIINDYIKESKLIAGAGVELKLKEEMTPRKRFIISTAINLALMGSIVLLIFIVTKIA